MKTTRVEFVSKVSKKETVVTNMETLKGSGVRTSYAWRERDVVKVPPMEELVLSAGEWREFTIYKIGVEKNGKVIFLPISSFRNLPLNERELGFSEEQRRLNVGDNFDAVTALAGRTVTVKELVVGDIALRDENGDFVYKDGVLERTKKEFPIFEIK